MATEDAVTSTAPAPAPVRPTGHPPGFWFFFWGEFAERCSYYGMRAILVKYMIDRLYIPEGDAGSFYSLFVAGCYFFPLIGGYIADNFLGKYWTIVGFSIPYVFAHLILGIENDSIVFCALVLLAMGSGVIKPNISTLLGLTYDQQRPGQQQLLTSAFNWFYMAINIGAAISALAMPWLRTHYSYQTAFYFPTGLMALALIIFALGKRFYARETIVRQVVGGDPETPLADGKTVTGIPVVYKIVTPEEKAADRAMKLETLSRIGLLFLTVMFFWAIFDQSGSTWIFFGNTYMNCTLFGVDAPPDSIQFFNPFFVVLMVPISVLLFKTLDSMGWRVKATQKMTLGFILTALSMVIMSLAGFLAGPKQEMMKLTAPEGVLILPNWDVGDYSKVTGTATVGTGVTVSGTDFKYDPDKKKLSLKNGKLILKGGKEVTIVAGHLTVANIPDASGLEAGGVAEPLLKSGADLAKVKPDLESDEVVLKSQGWVKPNERVTVWWQVLAFLIITAAEILISVTGLELAFVAAPQSMKSFITACWLATVFLANLLINAPITQLYQYLTPGVYFAILAGALLVVALVFQPVAGRFNRSMARMRATADATSVAEGNTEAM